MTYNSLEFKATKCDQNKKSPKPICYQFAWAMSTAQIKQSDSRVEHRQQEGRNSLQPKVSFPAQGTNESLSIFMICFLSSQRVKYESDCRVHLPLADVSYSRGVRDKVEGVAARVMSFPVKNINLSALSGLGSMLWVSMCANM